MDNLTHSLVGLVAAKAGLERVSPAATTLCVLAANAPDSDILATYGGRWFYLQHHRGITHSIVGTLALALLLPTLFWLGDQLIARVRHRPPKVKLRGLLLASLIVSATHPLLDWTNNYGLRPLLPWSGQWYYGDLVFIIDIFIWLTLGGTAFLLTAKSKLRIALWIALALVLTTAIVFIPTLRAGSSVPLAARVVWLVGVIAFFIMHRLRVASRWRSSLALCALALIVIYWGGLALLHRRALAQAQTVAAGMAAANGETTGRLAAMPVLANPLRWQCVFETERATYRFDLSLSEAKAVGTTVRFEKPAGEAAALYRQAAQDERARVFLGFARFPIARVEGDCLKETLVQLADLRYTEPVRGARGTFALEVPVECPPESGAAKEK
ncbi:MAG: metal-dependent hydrolase [Acidobacteria bacterium]|nr:metal-dependent hydrolase [Acidobacteriota bacterium]